jgi:urea transport system substrate-binding protein
MNKLRLPGNKALFAVAAGLTLFTIAVLTGLSVHTQPVIKIGILHSLTGTLSSSEKPLVDALQLAIEEVNATGGIKGQMLQAVISDCRSDPQYCAMQAERLISEENVSVLFGCWTSACRKAVKLVVEKHNHLLFYPVQYEGMEISPNILYTGAAPNQQLIPGIRWALENLGKRVYLVGSDYIFPRMANVIAKDMLKFGGGELAGERYLPLGTTAMAGVVDDIAGKKPNLVLNTLNGDSNVAFFSALKNAGIDAKKIPVMSFSLAEVELATMPTLHTAGHYAVWNYFQGLSAAENQAFVRRFQARFGATTVLDDPMEASYVGLHLWALAAREAGAFNPLTVQRTILRQTLNAPEGLVAFNANNRHLWKTPRVGRARADGQFDIVWSAAQAYDPAPFPAYRNREDWSRLLRAAGEKKR